MSEEKNPYDLFLENINFTKKKIFAEASQLDVGNLSDIEKAKKMVELLAPFDLGSLAMLDVTVSDDEDYFESPGSSEAIENLPWVAALHYFYESLNKKLKVLDSEGTREKNISETLEMLRTRIVTDQLARKTGKKTDETKRVALHRAKKRGQNEEKQSRFDYQQTQKAGIKQVILEVYQKVISKYGSSFEGDQNVEFKQTLDEFLGYFGYSFSE